MVAVTLSCTSLLCLGEASAWEGGTSTGEGGTSAGATLPGLVSGVTPSVPSIASRVHGVRVGRGG